MAGRAILIKAVMAIATTIIKRAITVGTASMGVARQTGDIRTGELNKLKIWLGSD